MIMKEKMKAVVKVRGEFGGTEWRTVEVPRPGPNDVLIKVDVVSICGTDVHIYEWNKWAHDRIKTPRIYGHEFAGHIVEKGANVSNVKIDDYVSGECHIACGYCHNCRSRLMHICENTKILGIDDDGIFAEYVKMPAMNVWKNDPSLKPELASIQDPLGNAVHAVFRCRVTTNNVVVFGVGPIGLLCVAVCKAIGAGQVIAVDYNNKYRIELAKKVGADYAVLSAETNVVDFVKEKTGGRGADVLIECAGAANAIGDCFNMMRPGGEMAILGLFGQNVSIDFPKDIVFKYANIYGINGRLIWDTWYHMAGLFRNKKFDVSPIITHKYKFDDFEKGMEKMMSGQSGKVVLTLD